MLDHVQTANKPWRADGKKSVQNMKRQSKSMKKSVTRLRALDTRKKDLPPKSRDG